MVWQDDCQLLSVRSVHEDMLQVWTVPDGSFGSERKEEKNLCSYFPVWALKSISWGADGFCWCRYAALGVCFSGVHFSISIHLVWESELKKQHQSEAIPLQRSPSFAEITSALSQLVGKKNGVLLSWGRRAHGNRRSGVRWMRQLNFNKALQFSSYILFLNTYTRHNSHMDRLGAGDDWWCLVLNSGLMGGSHDLCPYWHLHALKTRHVSSITSSHQPC